MDEPYRPLFVEIPLSSASPPAPEPRRRRARPRAVVQRWPEHIMPPSSWGTLPVQTPAPPRLRPIVEVMERIEIDRLTSTHTPCPLDEHDPLVDIALMILDG